MKKITKLLLVLVLVSLVALGLLVSCPAPGNDLDETLELSPYRFISSINIEGFLMKIEAPDIIEIENDDDGELNTPGLTAYLKLGEVLFDHYSDGEEDFKPYQFSVSLKATDIAEDSYDHVRIEPLEVTYNGEGEAGDFAIYLYSYSDHSWYNLVQTGWGTDGVDGGFELSNDEEILLKAFAFTSKEGTYNVTFRAIDLVNDGAEMMALR